MVNELVPLEADSFEVNVSPAKITVKNADLIKKSLVEYVKKYSGLVVTDETLQDSKTVKRQLNSLREQINRRRIDIHNDFDKPYNEFASEMKDWQAQIDAVLNPIKAGIKELDDQKKQQRADHVNDLLNEMAPNYDVDPDSITVDSSWLTAGISEIKRKKSIVAALKFKKADNDRIKANVEMITEYAKARDIDPAGWIVQAQQDNDTGLIKKQIDNEVKRRVEAETKQELDRKNKADYEEAMKNLEREKHGNTTVDTSTGEIVEQMVKFWVKGTPDVLRGVQKYLKDNNIEYGSVE